MFKNTGMLTPPSSFWKNDKYFVLDQLLLPDRINYIECNHPEDIAECMSSMNLRGAPLIGAAASAGVALFFNRDVFKESDFFYMLNMLNKTRPTAVNLKNVLDEAQQLFVLNRHEKCKKLFEIFKSFSYYIHSRDAERNIKIGENGAEFFKKYFKGRKINVLTHCNAGALATCGYGTALGIIRSLHKLNLIHHVWIDETRPYLQGSRLTAFEMVCENIPHTVITDSTAAWLMHEKNIDAVIVGADRVAINGDFANKIGTYSLAVNAHYHKIPFVSAMPLETFDFSISNGSGILIEERSDEELLVFNGKRIAHSSSKGLHLGFDVVPASLTTAIITEKGIVEHKITPEKIAGLINVNH